MNIDKIKKYIGFPLDEEYRAAFEQETCKHILNMEKFVCSFILLFQLIMIILISVKEGGPFLKPRRVWYFEMHVALLSLTLFLKLFCVFFRQCKNQNYKLCNGLFIGYAVFLGIWGCLITMIDQLGGNDLSVYSYIIVTVAVFAVLQPWQSVLLFGGCFVFLNVYLPEFQQSLSYVFGNIMNSMFITILSIAISYIFYRHRVFQHYDRIIINKQYDEIFLINQKLGKLVITDELTSMNNRRYLEDNMQRKLAERQANQAVSGMMIDIDYFKQYNDNYGHIEGDACLKKIARMLLEFAKKENAYAVRYGGEEFFVCIFDCDQNEALKKAEHLRAKIEICDFKRTDTPLNCVTVSIGVCTSLSGNNMELWDFIRQADEALYQAKNTGRNKVVLYT